MTQLGRALIAITLMISIGGQWAVLQSVAWVGMAISYSLQEGSLSTGLSQTFDGEHPCRLCCAIKKGKESESKEPRKVDRKWKLELFSSEARPFVIGLREIAALPRAAHVVAKPRSEEPPFQPPRLS